MTGLSSSARAPSAGLADRGDGRLRARLSPSHGMERVAAPAVICGWPPASDAGQSARPGGRLETTDWHAYAAERSRQECADV